MSRVDPAHLTHSKMRGAHSTDHSRDMDANPHHSRMMSTGGDHTSRPTPFERAHGDINMPVPGPHDPTRPVPALDPRSIPTHVALVMDGNGRWANAQGLPRTAGHRAGEFSLLDTVAGAIDLGVRYMSVYTFSTENWKRSPAEVRFIMTYATDVLTRRIDQLDQWGVRVRWSGRSPRLWKSVERSLRAAEKQTASNTTLDLVMNVNYGGRAEIADVARKLAERVAAGQMKPAAINEKTVARHLYLPDMPDVDLMIRTSGEQRISNFMLWQLAYAELMFVDTPWPCFDREALWECVADYASRDRRFGGAVDQAKASI